MVQKNSWTVINIKARYNQINLKDGQAYVQIYFLSFSPSISKPNYSGLNSKFIYSVE